MYLNWYSDKCGENDKIEKKLTEKSSIQYNIEMMFTKEEHLKCYTEWLDSFGGWKCFVEKNYLQDFVHETKDKNYGQPKELWEGHFEGDVRPIKKGEIEQFQKDRNQFDKECREQVQRRIEQFYKNAYACIAARSDRMIKTLKKS